jgi:hypothetical protein
MSKGIQLFALVVSVDIVMGPLLTLIVFNGMKPKTELVRDLSAIAALQFAALCYGVHVVFVARPVALVFEFDRFRVVAANEVLMRELKLAPPGFRQLSITGPRLMGTALPQTAAAKSEALDLALQGFDIGQRPRYWRSYAFSKAGIAKSARPIALLLKHYPSKARLISATLQRAGLPMDSARFAPVLSMDGDWSAVVNADGDLEAFIPLSAYF